MPQLILKVDVDTLRGTEEGVPRLLECLRKNSIEASFLFSLGPDHTGRAIKRVFRPGFFSKVKRTSVLEHYGIKTLLYGTLLPGPDIGRRCAAILRSARSAGHEVGIHTWDHAVWQDEVQRRSESWTRAQMQRAFDRFLEVFGEPPATHGAAGWQMTPAALQQLDDWGLAFASDGRIAHPGDGPYRVEVAGKLLRCTQLPTTLPTLDELIGIDGRNALEAARSILAVTKEDPRDHVFTLHAELEGGRLLFAFLALLAGWRDQGYSFSTLGGYYRGLDRTRLPVRRFALGTVAGRSGDLMVPAVAI